MKLFSFAFMVTFYLVCTHINCDINSSYFRKSPESLKDKIVFNSIVNKTNVTIVPHVSLEDGEDKLENFEIDLDDTLLSNEEKGKKCLKNITRCYEKDFEFSATTDKISNILFSSLPPFDLSYVKGVSPVCKIHSKQYVQDLKKFKMWALRMYDSSAKLPSGILNGNVNQLGDFDMCLNANLENRNIYGQYCLAAMEVKSPTSAYLSGLHRLIHSHAHFSSRLEDPGHRVPRFSSINWALCVPHSCTPKDVELGLRRIVKTITKDTEVELRLEVSQEMCQTSVGKSVPISTIIGTSFFGCVILFVLAATLYDHCALGNKNRWVLAFSLKKNVMAITNIARSAGDIEAVHGVRFLNAGLLILAHKSMALFFIPYVNRTEFVEYVSKPWTVIGRAASLYTDPFIMLSGTLTTYALLGKLQRTQKLNIPQEYVSRILRIVPTFAALIAFCTFVLPWLGSGPMWNQVITHHSDICKQNWWRNLLFIHNYYGFKDMCLTHTHHVGIDTQLFFTSPFLVYLIWKWPRNGAVSLITLASFSTIMRYYVTYTERLSNYIHFGTSVQQLFDTADKMYILPAHRLTVYIMGIFLGYLLRNCRNAVLSKTQLRIGNALAFFSFITSFFGPAFMGSIDYMYNPTHAACYAAFSPILWCFSFAWIIFTAHLGYKGVLGTIFSWSVFKLWTKISYTVYLTQFPIYFYNVGQTRSAENYGFFRMLFNFKEYSWLIILSVVLTLLFEMPFQNIRNIMFDKKDERTAEITKRKIS